MSPQKKILISEDVTGAGIDRLKQKYHVQIDPISGKKSPHLEEAIPGFDALIVRNQTKVTASLLSKGKALRVVGRAGAGYDNIDVPAASQAGVVVSYSPEENAVSVAEHVFALLLALARKIPGADRSVKSGGWERKKYHGVELMGKTLGIWGWERSVFAWPCGPKLLACDLGPRCVPLAHEPACHRIRSHTGILWTTSWPKRIFSPSIFPSRRRPAES